MLIMKIQGAMDCFKAKDNIVSLVNDSCGEVWKQRDQEGTIVIMS